MDPKLLVLKASNPELAEHLDSSPGSPKRILALDGGGVRGLVTLGILDRIETVLRKRSGMGEEFRLSHYFDLIAGTSTGAVIATALCMGWKVKEIVEQYKKLCPAMFREQRAMGLIKAVFDFRPVEKALKNILGETTQLQTDKLKTGLLICAKRIDTGAPWVLTNHPKSKFWDSPDDTHRPNKEYELWRVVRASAAAPHYFDPVEVIINGAGNVYPEQIGLFLDGAVAGLTNPSLQALLTALLPSYGFSWPRGKHKLLIVSVGTGWWRVEHDRDSFKNDPNWRRTIAALSGLVSDTSLHAITLMQALSTPRKPWRINAELEKMKGERLLEADLLSYQRYDARLDLETVRRVCVIRRPSDRRLGALLTSLQELTNADRKNMDHLFALGHDVGNVTTPGVDGIEPQDFPSAFDPPSFVAEPPVA